MAYAHVYTTSILVCGMPTDVEAHFTINAGLPTIEMFFYAGTDRELPPSLLECAAWEEPANFVVQAWRCPTTRERFWDVFDARFTVAELIECRLIDSGAHEAARLADQAADRAAELARRQAGTDEFIAMCREQYGRLP